MGSAVRETFPALNFRFFSLLRSFFILDASAEILQRVASANEISELLIISWTRGEIKCRHEIPRGLQAKYIINLVYKTLPVLFCIKANCVFHLPPEAGVGCGTEN